jgi:hypothetical protein
MLTPSQDLTADDRLAPGETILSQVPFVLRVCVCCLPGSHLRFSGIPSSAAFLPLHEQNVLLALFQGSWRLQLLPGGTNSEAPKFHADHVVVRRNELLAYSGHHRSRSVTWLKFWRGVEGRLYVDKTGSYMESADFPAGQVVLVNSLGYRMILHREEMTVRPVSSDVWVGTVLPSQAHPVEQIMI